MHLDLLRQIILDEQGLPLPDQHQARGRDHVGNRGASPALTAGWLVIDTRRHSAKGTLVLDGWNLSNEAVCAAGDGDANG